jgi:monofunctional biosynthetic peptidoglycan transglycosylase
VRNEGRAARPTTAFVELRADEARARHAEPRRVQRWMPYNRVSGSLKRAVLVTEDDAFWQHDGIDVKRIEESLELDLQKGTFSRGGSTITQQLAKNLYLSPSKNPVRKLRELLIARRLEASLTKTRIFEIYLNVIEWGDGIYGAEAAALLAACIINPES